MYESSRGGGLKFICALGRVVGLAAWDRHALPFLSCKVEAGLPVNKVVKGTCAISWQPIRLDYSGSVRDSGDC